MSLGVQQVQANLKLRIAGSDFTSPPYGFIWFLLEHVHTFNQKAVLPTFSLSLSLSLGLSRLNFM